MADKITVYDDEYPARRLLDLVGDKWTPIVLYILGEGTKRYGEMRRRFGSWRRAGCSHDGFTPKCRRRWSTT